MQLNLSLIQSFIKVVQFRKIKNLKQFLYQIKITILLALTGHSTGMFQLQEQGRRQSSAPKEMQIYLIQNGSPDRLLKYEFKRPLNKQEVARICQRNWETKYKSIRFFTIDGVEFQDEDLTFIKNKERIYVSRGEEFDYESNFGQYKILKPLGEGGFGKVMLAQNIITKELAAVKIIKVQKICGASDIDMIFRQIQNLKALNHPNIVKIINCYMLKNMQVYVVMQYLEGGQLLKMLKQRKYLPEEQAKHYFKQITSAVSYCHRENIIHRDLKVENILFKSREERIIKVADFGISGVADQFNPDFDVGTLKYMAPQVLTAKQKSNTPAVDVWACGVILYYMVYGVLPFNGTHSSQITQAICEAKYVFPKQPFVSQQCKNLIKNILQASPKKRIRMQDVRQDPWLQTRQAKFRKQLSLKMDYFHIAQDKGVVEQDKSSKLDKLQQIVVNAHRVSQAQSDKKRNKGQKKLMNLPRNQRKNNLYPVINVRKRSQREKEKTTQDIQAHEQRSPFLNHRRPERKPVLYKGNSIQIAINRHSFNNNGINGSSLGVNYNYCSQQLPSIKEPLPNNKLSRAQIRGNQSMLNSSNQKLEQKSKEGKQTRLKKKLSVVNGWK